MAAFLLGDARQDLAAILVYQGQGLLARLLQL